MNRATPAVISQVRIYHCAMCGRALEPNHWIYSSHTGARYCYVGEGCWLKSKKRKVS